MHPGAYEFVRRVVRALPLPRRVCELGSRDVNGSVRPLFRGSVYVGVDCRAGPGVDVVADAADWPGEGAEPFDLVVCTEVLEHTPRAAAICERAWRLLKPGGVLLLTAATDPRPAHGVDGDPDPAGRGEYYANVPPGHLRIWLESVGFGFVLVDAQENVGDVYALAVR